MGEGAKGGAETTAARRRRGKGRRAGAIGVRFIPGTSENTDRVARFIEPACGPLSRDKLLSKRCPF